MRAISRSTGGSGAASSVGALATACAPVSGSEPAASIATGLDVTANEATLSSLAGAQFPGLVGSIDGPPAAHNETRPQAVSSPPMSDLFNALSELMDRGGPVMWPLLALSLLSVALVVERALYWLSAHRPGRSQWVLDVADRLRASDAPGARAIVAKDRSIYGRVARSILAAPR